MDKHIGRNGARNAKLLRQGRYQRWVIKMPSQKEVLAAITSSELFTDEYQEACRQRKAAVLFERGERAKHDNDFYTKLWEENKAKRVTGDVSPYAGKESGEFVGD